MKQSAAAAEIINSIDELIAELQKAQEQEQTEVQEIGQDAPPQEGQESPTPWRKQDYGYSGRYVSGATGSRRADLFTQDGIEVAVPYEDDTGKAVTSLDRFTGTRAGEMGDLLWCRKGTPEKCPA